MSSTRCFCGAAFEGTDDGLVDLMQGHLEQVHGLVVGPVTVRNAIERQRRLGPVPERVPSLGVVSLSSVSGATTEDYFELFDEHGFTDNVGWASCYCMFHHLDPASWESRTWQQNRADMLERLRAGATTGVLAHVDGVIAGWVNAGRLSGYPAHCHGDDRDERTGAIVCFVVAPAYRRHGLGSLLLDAACDLLRDADLSGVEAYPSDKVTSAASAYHGTPEMYRRAGFEASSDGVVFRSL